MYSKRTIHTFLLACVLSGCSLKLNDEPQKPPTSMSAGGGCLTAAGNVMERFSQGQLDAASHVDFFKCLDQAVVTFGEATTGRNPGYFEPDEIGSFLTKYFLDGKSINPSLLHEALTLKSAFIGGRPDRLSWDDLRRLRQVMHNLRELTSKLRTIMPLNFEAIQKKNLSQEEFAGMMRIFIDSTTEFGERMGSLQGEYRFESLASLMRELQRFDGTPVPDDHWTNRVIHFSKIIPPAKVILVSPPRNSILGADWKKIYHQGSRYFAAFLRTQYYMQRPYDLAQGSGLVTLESLYSDFVTSFGYMLDQHPDKMISSDEIDDLFQTLYANKVITFSPATGRQAVRLIFGKLLGSSAKADFAITHDSLNNFSENMRFLFEGLRVSEALYRIKHDNAFLSGSLTRAEIEAVPSADLLKSTQFGSALSLEAVEAIKATPRLVNTVFTSGNFGVAIPKDGVNRNFPYWHMVKTHTLRAVDRLLIHSYGDPREDKMSEAQFNAFADDLFPILTELGLVGESMRPSIAKRLFEASLFLPSSDGDKGLTMSEAIELESVILSTLENTNRVHSLLANACGTTKLDPSGKPLINGACYRQKYGDLHADVLRYVPGMAEDQAKLGAAGRQAFFDKLSALLRSGQTIADDYTHADTLSMVLMPYYVETIFSRFDTNRDGKLVNAEGEKAYPLFQKFIAEMAGAQGINKPKDHIAIFHFILGYRALPNEKVWAYILRRYLFGPKKYSVDRSQVVEIFAKLMKSPAS